MSNQPCRITPDLISDYVADRLDDEDARGIEEAIEHNDEIATAVAAARQVNARVARSFATAVYLRRVEGHHRLVTRKSPATKSLPSARRELRAAIKTIERYARNEQTTKGWYMLARRLDAIAKSIRRPCVTFDFRAWCAKRCSIASET